MTENDSLQWRAPIYAPHDGTYIFVVYNDWSGGFVVYWEDGDKERPEGWYDAGEGRIWSEEYYLKDAGGWIPVPAAGWPYVNSKSGG